MLHQLSVFTKIIGLLLNNQNVTLKQADTAFSFPMHLQGLMTLSCGVKAQDQTEIKAIKDRVDSVSIFTKLVLYIFVVLVFICY